MRRFATTWSECLELYNNLQNGKPGISNRIKEVNQAYFGDFIKLFTLLDPSKQKEEIQAVKTVVKKIKHLKKCSTDLWNDESLTKEPIYLDDLPLSVSDHYKILRGIFDNVKIDQLDVSYTKFSPNCVFHIIQLCKVSEVKSLLLRRCDLKSGHLAELAINAANFELKLEELDFSWNYFSSNCMNHLVDICKICHVKSLKLRKCKLESEHLVEIVNNADDTFKIDHLDVSLNNFCPNSMPHLSQMCKICCVKSLTLIFYDLPSDHLTQFRESAEVAILKLEELDVSWNRIFLNDVDHLVGICKICEVKTLKLKNCCLDLKHLVQFAENSGGIKLVELDISENYNIFKRNALPGVLARLSSTKECVSQLVKLCEIYQLKKLCVRLCGLKSDQIRKFVELAKNTQIVEMDIKNNPDIDESTESKLMQFLEHNKTKIRREAGQHVGKKNTSPTADKEVLSSDLSDEEILVKNIYPSVSAPFTTAVSFDPSDVERIETNVKESLSAPVIRGGLIGPDGISIRVLDCVAEYSLNAFRERTPVLHSVSSAYYDAPDGFVSCSPELECDTFGAPVQGTVTVTLPLHDLPENGQVVIFKKTENSVAWEPVDSFPCDDGKKTVTFPVSRFSRLKAFCSKLLRRKTLLCQYLFYKPGSFQLFGVTCINTKAVINKCVSNYVSNGFVAAQPLPDQIRLYKGERMTYKYECLRPTGIAINPSHQVFLKKKDIQEYHQQPFVLECPESLNTVGSVMIQYLLATPQRVNKSPISLTINALTDKISYSPVCATASNVSSHLTAAGIGALGDATPTEENVHEPATTTAGDVSGHAAAARGIALIHSTGARGNILCQASHARETTVGSITLGLTATSAGNMSGQTTNAVGTVLVYATALGVNTMGQTTTAGGSTMSHTNNAGGNTLGQNITAGGAALVQTATAGRNALIQTPTTRMVAVVHATTSGVNTLVQTTNAGRNTMAQTTTAGGNTMAQTTTAGRNMLTCTTVAGRNTFGHSVAAIGSVIGGATVPVQELNIRKCTKEFYEGHLTDEEIYPFELNCIKGKVLIINNEFEGNEELEREGSEIDVENLQMLWTALGFEVNVMRNLTAAGMRLSIGEFARGGVNVSSVFLIIMSHGGRSVNGEFICGEDMGIVPTENIISFFTSQNSPHLRGIPKVFMFQACRGNLRDRADAGSFDEPRRPRTSDRADMLIAYPCQSGNVSFRNSVTGSWLMNEVTKIFRSRAHNSDLLAMLTMVNNKVTKREGQLGDMQASNQETYLTRKLYLFPGWPN